MSIKDNLFSYSYYPLYAYEKLTKLFNVDNSKLRVLLLHEIPKNMFSRCENILRWLSKEWDFISPEEFSEILEKKKVTGKKILLTFDDGFYSNYLVAKEVLDPLGIKAIFFVPTGFIDSNSRYDDEQFIMQNMYEGSNPPNIDEMKSMNWENLSELIQMDHVIGAHTRNHLRLSDINDNNLLKEEIILSGDRIEEMLGIRIEQFAFPFGDINSINKRALQLAKKRYKYIFSGVRGCNRSDTNPFAIRRDVFDIENGYDYNRFIARGGLSFYYWRDRQQLDDMVA